MSMRGLSGLIGMTAAFASSAGLDHSVKGVRRMRGRRGPGKPGPKLFAGAPIPPPKLTAEQQELRNKRKAAAQKRAR
jgi:hypothetical protein